MKTYLEISISSTEEQQELLLPTMIELGCQGFQQTDSALLCYFEVHADNPQGEGTMRSQLSTLLRTISSNAEVRFRKFKEENWNTQWEQSIRPIEIEPRLVIKPSWYAYPDAPEKIIIEIDPKMSFGTGYHESTRLMLRLLQQTVKTGMRVLDVGTGTGILAIASVKLGAASARGIDIDAWSLTNAAENTKRNEVEDRITIDGSQLTSFHTACVDLICANLTLNTNLEHLKEFHRLLTPGGQLLLSGLLAEDESQMIQALKELQFSDTSLLAENEWIAISARRTA